MLGATERSMVAPAGTRPDVGWFFWNELPYAAASMPPAAWPGTS